LNGNEREQSFPRQQLAEIIEFSSFAWQEQAIKVSSRLLTVHVTHHEGDSFIPSIVFRHFCRLSFSFTSLTQRSANGKQFV